MRTLGPRRLAAIRNSLSALVLLGAFFFSVRVRSPLFGMAPGWEDSLWRSNTSFALNAARNWFVWSPSGLGFRIFIDSVENGAFPDSLPYRSYPPLFVAAPWLLARFFGIFLSFRLLNFLSLMAQLSLGVTLCLWLRALAREAGAKPWTATALSTICGALTLTLPAFVFFYQQDWWPDLIGLPLLTTALWWDAEAARWKDRPWYSPVFGILLLLAALADWMGFLLAGVLLLRRALHSLNFGTKKGWGVLLIPALVAAAIIIVTLGSRGSLLALLSKFHERSGISSSPKLIYDAIFLKELFRGSKFWYFLMLGATPLLVFHRVLIRSEGPKLRLTEGTLLLSLPLFAHLLIVNEHYYAHEYEWMKFGLLIVTVPFFFLPMLLLRLIPFRTAETIVTVAAFSGAVLFASGFPQRYADRFTSGAANLDAGAASSCDALFASFRAGEKYVSPNFYTRGGLEKSATPAPYSQIELSRACFQAIDFVPHPAAPDSFPAWYEIERKYSQHAKLVAVFFGAVPADWKDVIVPSTLRKVGNLELYDLNFDAIRGMFFTSLPGKS